jgi:hypothetical protein
MSIGVYKMHHFSGIVSHSELAPLLCYDREDESVHEIDVEVSSGDYFVTLATKLDRISAEITEYHARAEIEEMISGLIYLQDAYDIIKKRLGKE